MCHIDISRPAADKLKSDGLKTPNPSGFAVLGRFTATGESDCQVNKVSKINSF